MKDFKNFLKEQCQDFWKKLLGGFILFFIIFPIGFILHEIDKNIDQIINLNINNIDIKIYIFSILILLVSWLILKYLFFGPLNNPDNPVEKILSVALDLFAALIVGFSIPFLYSQFLFVIFSSIIMLKIVNISQEKYKAKLLKN